MLRALLVFTLISAPSASAVETIRILVAKTSAPVVLKAELLGFDHEAEGLSFTPVERDRARVALRKGRLQLNRVALETDVIRLRSLAPVKPFVRVLGKSLAGDVEIRRRGRQLEVINVLPLEDYLVGVLDGEMPRSFHPEARKAQAVAARTYALSKKLAALGEPYHLGASVLSQVYKGLLANNEATRKVVSATNGMVLTYQMTPIEAYFHSSCGGRTETGRDALGRDLPYLRSVDCPCNRATRVQWRHDVSLRDYQKVFGVRSVSPKITSRSRTGRVRRLALGDGRYTEGVLFRQRLGYGKVKSLRFEIQSRHRDRVTLTGSGHGHGAGLCQWGAHGRAQSGWSHARILAHYYRGAVITKMY